MFLSPCALQDMGELEAAVAQHLLPLEQLGAPARILRAFRRLLFMPREDSGAGAAPAAPAAAAPAGGEGEDGGAAGATAPAALPPGAAVPAPALGPLLRDLPRTALLHYLFSQGPPGLESPHARAGLTPVQYSLWLDEHSQVRS